MMRIPWRSVGILVLGLLVVGVSTVTSIAAPPEDLPTIGELEKALLAEKEAADEAVAAAARDPDREFLKAYAEGRETNHAKVVQMIANASNDQRSPGLREAAAKAIIDRFRKRPASIAEKRFRALKKRASVEVLKLLDPVRASRVRVNELGIAILKALWNRTGGYKVDGKSRDKRKWKASWKSYLKRQ